MRILHVLDHSLPLHSGYVFRTLSILKAQRELGWETFHITSEKQGKYNAPEEEIEGWKFFRTPPYSGPISRMPMGNPLSVMKGLARRLHEVVMEIEPDILHAHSPSLNVFPALKVGKRFGIPVVYEVRAFWEDAAVDHGSTAEGSLRYRMTRAMDTRAFGKVDAVTTICEGLRKDIVERGVPESKVTVIPNAVDIGDFSIDGKADIFLKETLGLKDLRVLGFIGSFYAYEGLALLINALPGITEKYADAAILLVGGGPQEPALRELAKSLGLEKRIIFTGRVPHEKVQDYYNLIDVLVYPRLSMRLTELVTPLKPLEAMAQGKPLLASDVGGHRELIRNNETGMLFRAGDVEDLAEKALLLLNDDGRRFRTAGRLFVEQERNWAASVARYKPVYEALVSGKRHD